MNGEDGRPPPEQPLRLPHDSGAERAVLGSILLDPLQLDGIREVLRATDFLDRRHQAIFEACCTLDEAGGDRRIDLVTVRAELERTDKLTAIGGSAFLGDLFDGVARSSNAVEYARVVRQHALSRELHRLGKRVASEALRAEPREVLAEAEKDLFDIAGHTFASGPARLGEELRRIEDEARRPREGFAGIRTDFQDLDNLMGGLRKSDLILVGARPGAGKTSLALNIALAAGRAGKTVLIFSLEMPMRQIAVRLLFSQARVDARQLSRPGMFSEMDRKRLGNAVPILAKMPLFVDDSPVTPVEIRSKARQQSRDAAGLDLIVVDYLQLMRGAPAATRRFENRTLEVADISRSLKLLAKELDVPVLALSQLRRPDQRRALARPELSDLRESGALEQDADIVLLIHHKRRKRTARGDESGNLADEGPPTRVIHVAKNRNGPTGEVTLAWLDRFTRFETLENVEEAAGSPAFDDFAGPTGSGYSSFLPPDDGPGTDYGPDSGNGPDPF